MSNRNFSGAAPSFGPNWTHRFSTEQQHCQIPMSSSTPSAQQSMVYQLMQGHSSQHNPLRTQGSHSGFQNDLRIPGKYSSQLWEKEASRIPHQYLESLPQQSSRHDSRNFSRFRGQNRQQYGKRKRDEFPTNNWKASRGQLHENISKDPPIQLTNNQKKQPQAPNKIVKTKSVAVQCLWEEDQEWPGLSYVSARDWTHQRHGLWDHPTHWTLCTQESLSSSPGSKYITPSVGNKITRPGLPWKRPPPPPPEPSPQTLENIQFLQQMNETLSSELKKMKEKFSAIEQALEQISQEPPQQTSDPLASVSSEKPPSVMQQALEQMSQEPPQQASDPPASVSSENPPSPLQQEFEQMAQEPPSQQAPDPPASVSSENPPSPLQQEFEQMAQETSSQQTPDVPASVSSENPPSPIQQEFEQMVQEPPSQQTPDAPTSVSSENPPSPLQQEFEQMAQETPSQQSPDVSASVSSENPPSPMQQEFEQMAQESPSQQTSDLPASSENLTSPDPPLLQETADL